MALAGQRGAKKKTRFKEEQMVKILRESDQAPVAEVAKRHGVSGATIYGWRQRFGGPEATDVKRKVPRHRGYKGLIDAARVRVRAARTEPRRIGWSKSQILLKQKAICWY
jgi:transposase-like protein